MSMEYYVDPDGDDSAPGTEDRPFATLARAKEEVRGSLETDSPEGMTVYLRAGVHRLSEPLVFGPADSGSSDCQVTYTAYPGEEPVVSGGQTLDEWDRANQTSAIDRLSEEARDEVWVADLAQLEGDGGRFSALFDEDGLLTRAHSESKQTVRRDAEPENHEEGIHEELHFEGDDLREWPNLGDVEIFLTPEHPWTVNYLPVASVDEERNIARTELPSTYPLTTHWGWGLREKFYRVENLPEFLSGPGQWAVDTDEGLVYLWPRDEEPGEITVPQLNELVRFEGDFETSDWVEHITLSDLTFSHGDRMRWAPERESLQHDWDQYDEANALVRVRGAEHVNVDGCRFVHSGSSGIRLDLHAVDNVLDSNEIADLGGTGILLAGYGPGTRDENHHNEVTHNHVHHTARQWWHSPGIFVWQSGHNHIHTNLIHNLPYTGIVVSGPRTAVFDQENPRYHEGYRTIRFDELDDTPLEWEYLLGYRHARHNLIEHNEVHHTMERLGDGNGIYLSGTGPGNVVRRNYVHHLEECGTQSGIRMDDEQYYTKTTENVVWRINGAGITSKRINDVENNVVSDCYKTIEEGQQAHITVRGDAPTYGTCIRRNIVLQSDRDDRLPIFEFTPEFEQAAVDDNVFYNRTAPEDAEETLERLHDSGKGTRSLAADPKFVDADNGDFSLEADSPAFDVGFRPFEEWGTTEPVGPAESE